MNFLHFFIVLIFSLNGAKSVADAQSSILGLYMNAPSKTVAVPMKLQWNKDKKAKILSTDTNSNGEPDIFDYFSPDGSVIERREDRNFDGKIDKITLFPKHFGEKLIIKSDENFDGKFERIEERWQDGDYIVVHIKIDTKSKGIFDFETTSRIKRDTALEVKGNSNCIVQNSTSEQLKNIQGLSKLFGDVAEIGSLSDDFYLTNFGYKIQKSCADGIGAKKVVGIVSNSLKKGLACLWQLGSPQSKANVHKIASLLLDEKNPPQIICDDKKYDWGSATVAYGSTPGQKSHPFISINPSRIDNGKIENLSATVFHETLHNVGYLHEKDIDFPYTCETCCFDESAKKAHDLACQICKGQYTGTNDRKYINDITNFFSLAERDERNMGILLNYLNDNPKDRSARFKLITANSSEFTSPLAVAFAQALKGRYSPMANSEKSDIEKIERSGISDYTKLFMSPARSTAESLLKLLDGDLSSAEGELRKIQIPDRGVSSSVDNFNYKFMSNKIKHLKNDIAWKIYEQYEALGNTEARNRVFDEFLDPQKK
ncbi:MAG: hypothetical protein ACXVCN_19685 [Bdellovibrio sp.]